MNVVVDDERTRIEVQSEPPPQVGSTRRIWGEDEAFAEFEKAPPLLRAVAETFRRLRRQYPEVRIDLGTGQVANLLLKHRGHGLLEIQSNGYVACRPRRFVRALGEKLGAEYRMRLEALFPKPLTSVHPGFTLDPSKDGPLIGKILKLLQSILAKVSKSRAVNESDLANLRPRGK